jgi:hypothetical protein
VGLVSSSGLGHREDLLFGRQQVYEASISLRAAKLLLEPCEPDAAWIGNPSSQQVFVG